MNWKTVLNTWKNVFGNWKYMTATLGLAFVFYSANVIISSWKSIIGFYSTLGFFGTINFFFTLFVGFRETIKLSSFVSLIIISLLFGMLFSLVGYRVNLDKGNGVKKIGFFGGIGLFLAAFAPGCAARGIGLVSILGIGASFLSFLPYEGLELSIASIAILGFTIIKITKDMYICKIQKYGIK